jgi:hypothetical protein
MKIFMSAALIVMLSTGIVGAQNDTQIDPKSILGMLRNIENSTRDTAATLRRLEIKLSRQNQPNAAGPFLQPIVPPYVCNITALGDGCKGFAEGICKSLNFAKAANVADQIIPLPSSAMIPGDQHTITAVTCND